MHQPAVAAPAQPPASLIVGLLTSVVAIAFETVAVATAMPEAARQLGRLDLYAWTFSLFVIAMALSTVLAGRWCDRHGPVRALQAALALFGMGLVLATLAPSMQVLLVARFIQGFGGGAFNVALMVVVAQVFAPGARAKIMTAFSVCWVLPAFIAPPIAAWLTHHLSWHWVFASMLPAVLLTAVLTHAPLRRLRAATVPDQTGESDPVPLWAAFVATLGVALIQFAGQRLDRWSPPLLAAGLVCLGLSLPRLMAPGFFRFAPGIATISWTRALQAGTFFAVEAFLPLSLVTIRGLSLFMAGLTLTVGSLGWTIGSWVQAREWLMLRRDQVIQVGVLCSFLGMATIVASTALGWPAWTVGLGWTIGGLGMGLGMASTTLAMMSLSSPAQIGRNTSSLQVAEALGTSLFTGLAGAIHANLRVGHSSVTTFSSVFGLMLALAVLGLLVSLRMGRVPNLVSGAGAQPSDMMER